MLNEPGIHLAHQIDDEVACLQLPNSTGFSVRRAPSCLIFARFCSNESARLLAVSASLAVRVTLPCSLSPACPPPTRDSMPESPRRSSFTVVVVFPFSDLEEILLPV